MAKFVVLSAADVTSLLTMAEAVESQRRAFRALADGSGILAPKAIVEGADGSFALNYTARSQATGSAVSKFVSVNPTNLQRDLPMIHGVITVLDPETGQLAAVLDGTSVTTIRTAAASAAAVDALARPSSEHLVVVGSGVQAQAHVRALTSVREFAKVTVVGRNGPRVQSLTRALSEELGRPIEARTEAASVVPGADVVALCTASFTPVVEHGWLSPGVTLVSVGSFAQDRCEVQRATVTAADLVVVDDLPTSVEHAGPIIQALQTGALREQDVVTIGEVLLGRHPGRTGEDEVIFYNSVGVGIQDTTAAEVVLERARTLGRGQTVEF